MAIRWYVWSPCYQSADKPIIFIPLEQFKQLLKEIDSAFPNFMTRMPEKPEGVLVFPFEYSEHKLLRPHFLGESSNKDDFERLSNIAPHFGSLEATPLAENDAEVLTCFRQDMDAAVDAGRNKGKMQKARKQEARAVKQLDMVRQLERTQRSLGLLSSSPPSFEGDIVYIAVDVESYERNHNIITEIGVATLDTRDLHEKPHGENGKDWHQFIRARHFRINEYKNYVNSEFVNGCPDCFEFGESEFIDLKDAPRVIASCFKGPYNNKDANSDPEAEHEKRNIIFLGHDTKQDVAYLRNLGYDPSNLSNLVDFQDTAAMHRAATGESQTRGLAHIMYKLELEAWNAHNAGNDAVYTMQAMLGLCIKDAAKKTTQTEDQDGGGVSLVQEAASPPLKAKQEPDPDVVKTIKKFQEWQM